MREAVVDLEEGPVHYADYGGEGEPLLVVHGIGGSHINCSRLAPELSNRFHVYALDLVGFGRTALAGRDASMASNQVMIGGFIAHVAGVPSTVLGHSMGGALALLLAAGDPPAVSRLILLCPAVGDIQSPLGHVSTGMLSFLARYPRLFAPLLRAQVRLDPKGAVRSTLRKYVRDLDELDPFLVDAHVQMERQRCRARGAYLGYLQAWRSMLEETGDIEEFVKIVVNHVEAPTLLIHGADDVIVPPAFARLAHGLRPDWSVVELPTVGHAPRMERPQRTAELILEWVRRLESEATPR